MALESADLLTDPFPSTNKLDLAAESSELRIRREIPLESGIPPARARA